MLKQILLGEKNLGLTDAVEIYQKQNNLFITSDGTIENYTTFHPAVNWQSPRMLYLHHISPWQLV